MFVRGMSLADKCQLLFGAAVVLIIAAALLVPWFRMGAVVDQSQLETSRQLARLWEVEAGPSAPLGALGPGLAGDPDLNAPRIELLGPERLDESSASSPFLAQALRRFREARARPVAEHYTASWDGDQRVYRYARANRDPASGALTGVIFVERRSEESARMLLVNRLLVIAAFLVASALAVALFHVITTRIILSPVRKLRRTAEAVREGDLSLRASIATGDEFEELSEAFNDMLAGIAAAQDQLRSNNLSLDLRVNELAQSNVALHEANRVKSEFLANVSHELRTPLNSIIGFAELLQALLAEDEGAPGIPPERTAAIVKRKRYLENIVGAGRDLLVMINELLEMARIEAGKVELRLERMHVGAACDGLLALIRPQAERKGIRLALELPAGGRPDAEGGLPAVVTDPRKFQQVVFNFLSNAVKFTPEDGAVTLRAERLVASDGQDRVRVSVLDTGPGIREEDQQAIFEKFRQLDAGHTRQAGGTGLGLAIAREFAATLGGEIQLVSAPGRGSMFSLIVPVRHPSAELAPTPEALAAQPG